MTTDEEFRKKKFIDIHVNARKAAGRSQEFMALELNVSKRTIQNWEKGISYPSLYHSLEWFRALSINPIPLYMSLISSKSYSQEVNKDMSDEEVDAALKEVISLISPQSKRALLYLFLGKHGSSAYSVLQLMLAHLHLPLKDRLINARSVLFKYEMAKSTDEIICKSNIKPDTTNLETAIDKAHISLNNRDFGYNNIDER